MSWLKTQIGLNRKRVGIGALLALVVVILWIEVPDFIFTLRFVWEIIGFVSCYVIAVLLHELGHAVAHACLRDEVRFITLGSTAGKKKFRRFRFLGFEWRLYSIPFSGVVYPIFYTSRFYRLRVCLGVAAGPATTLLCFLSGLYFCSIAEGSVLESVAWCWMLVNAVLLFSTVVPAQYGKMANDGLLFLNTLGRSNHDIQVEIQYALLHRDHSNEIAQLKSLTLDQLIARYESSPARIGILWHLLHRLYAEKSSRFYEYLDRFAAHPDFPPPLKISVIDGALTAELMKGPSISPDSYDRLSRQLVELSDTITTRGTRGSVLIELGRIEEGKAMLKDVLAKREWQSNEHSLVDQIFSQIFLAIAEKKQGNIKEARERARMVSEFVPTYPALRRLRDLLDEPLPAGAVWEELPEGFEIFERQTNPD